MTEHRSSSVSRRTITSGLAWAAPTIAGVAAAPAFAASPVPVLSSVLWFSGHGTTTSYTSTCSVPNMTSPSGACGTPTSTYPWRNRFQFYGTDESITSDAGTCTRDSSIAVTNLTSAQITGPVTLSFWRPEHPQLDSSYDVRTWYRGANDSGRWSVPVRTATAPQTPFSGTWAGVRMYEYQTTLSLANAQTHFIGDGQGGVSLRLTRTGAALSFFSDCMPFDSTKTQAYLDAYDRLGRYVLTVPTSKGTLTKDTGFYTT